MEQDYKYYMADYEQLCTLEGEERVGYTGAKQEVTKEEFEGHISDFYLKSDATEDVKNQSKNTLWSYLKSGKTVTVGNKTLTLKKIKHAIHRARG